MKTSNLTKRLYANASIATIRLYKTLEDLSESEDIVSYSDPRFAVRQAQTIVKFLKAIQGLVTDETSMSDDRLENVDSETAKTFEKIALRHLTVVNNRFVDRNIGEPEPETVTEP